jgi:hypothetical protein
VERDVSACVGAKIAATLLDAYDVERAGIATHNGESRDDHRNEADG